MTCLPLTVATAAPSAMSVTPADMDRKLSDPLVCLHKAAVSTIALKSVVDRSIMIFGPLELAVEELFSV